MKLKWVKGSCRVSLSAEADALLLMVYLNLCALSGGTVCKALLFLSKNVAWGGALHSTSTLLTSKAEQSCFSLLKYGGLCPCIPLECCGSFSTTTSLYPRWPFTWMQREQMKALMDYLEWYEKRRSFQKGFDRQAKKSERFQLLSRQMSEKNWTASSVLSLSSCKRDVHHSFSQVSRCSTGGI